MSFEDDMIEYGFSDGNDYMDYLMDEADRMYEKQEEHNRRAEEYEAWLNSLSDTERQYLQEEENIQRRERKKRQKDAKQKRLDEELVLKLWAKDNPQKAKMWYAYYTHSPEVNNGEFYQFNLSSCIRQQNSLTAQFVSFSLANLANIFYPPRFLQ